MRIYAQKIMLFAAFSAPLLAQPYQWNSRSGESPFKIDIPENWRPIESVKKNGVIVQFRKGEARIEVRSFVSDTALTIPQIINQKAARLASEYSSVRLIEERDSKFQENLHLSVWEIQTRNRFLREETAIILATEGPVVVSCLVPQSREKKYRTICDNAFYSLALEGDSHDNTLPAQKIAKASLMDSLGRFYFFHVPGNFAVLAPETVLQAPEISPPQTPRRIEYDDNFILPNDFKK
ncbi:MAG: hypothetical protein LDLANPLL_02206 [Turneriella sp.]|nr:hypothetical protein [Turneriella sp.]